MTGAGVEDRLRAARRLLDRSGVAADVSAAGMKGEIAAVRGGPVLRQRLAELAPAIRSLGFRYVALDPDPINHYDEDS